MYGIKKNKIENLEFVQGVKSELINSLKNNGTKYLLIFHDSCAEICYSKESMDNANAGRCRGLSTIYIKYNLLHQTKLGREIELQNTHIVFLKSLQDVHQVGTLSVQLGLGSTLVNWYRDSTILAFGHLLIDLSPRTDNRIRYCTYIPSKFSVPELFQHFKHLANEHTKSGYPPSVPTSSPTCQKQFLKTCPKNFMQFLNECIVNLLQGKLQEIIRNHVLKYRKDIQALSLKGTTLS